MPSPSISDYAIWLKELHINGSKLSEEHFKSLKYILSLSIDVKTIIDSKQYPQWHPVSEQLIDIKTGIKKIESIFDDVFIMREDATSELLSIHRQLKKIQAKNSIADEKKFLQKHKKKIGFKTIILPCEMVEMYFH